MAVQVLKSLALDALQHVPLLVILFLFQCCLHRRPCFAKLLQLPVDCVHRGQLAAHVQLDQFFPEDCDVRGLVLLEFDCHRLSRVSPLTHNGVEVPVSKDEVTVESLHDLGGTCFQVLSIV
jgi:hypothetical protein